MPSFCCKEADVQVLILPICSLFPHPSLIVKMAFVADLDYTNLYHHFRQISESAATCLLVYPYLNTALDTVCPR